MFRFVSKRRKTSNAVGMPSLIFLIFLIFLISKKQRSFGPRSLCLAVKPSEAYPSRLH